LRGPLRLAGGAIALVMLLAALPVGAQARAKARTAAVTLPPGGITTLSASALVELLGEDELGESGARGLPVSALEVPLLARLLSSRGPIPELANVNGLGGTAGVEGAMRRAINELADEGELVEELVGNFGLASDFEEQLEEAFEESGVENEPGGPESLEEAVEEALGSSPEEVIDAALGTLSLSELLSRLLAEAANPDAVAGALFSAAEPEELQELLGTSLSGQPFALADVAETAEAAELSSAELAQALGQSPSELPEGARALLASLSDGRVLGVFAGSKALASARFGPPSAELEPEPQPEEEEEEEESGAGGGSGTETSEGGSPPPQMETPLTPGPDSGGSADVGAPQTTLAQTTPSAPAVRSEIVPQASAPARVRILGHSVRGGTLTLVFRIPATGRLVVSGNGVRPAKRSFTRSTARASVRLDITRTVAAALRRRGHLQLRLAVSFRPADGAPSSTSIAVRLG
jgi:hypothetical protein